MPSDWVGFWDDAPTVYVSAQHKSVHYQSIAKDIVRHVPQGGARVLDFGCGEALSADLIAAKCVELYLCDAAETVRAALKTRFAGVREISVVAPDSLAAAIPAGSLDLIVVNSVAQYLTPERLGENIKAWMPLLRPGGRILLADIIPPDVGAVADAGALLKLAARNGFLLDALVGLGRIYFSNYRTLRGALGLTKYADDQFIEHLNQCGLAARRVYPNLGHNQRRMAFLASIGGGLNARPPNSSPGFRRCEFFCAPEARGSAGCSFRPEATLVVA